MATSGPWSADSPLSRNVESLNHAHCTTQACAFPGGGRKSSAARNFCEFYYHLCLPATISSGLLRTATYLPQPFCFLPLSIKPILSVLRRRWRWLLLPQPYICTHSCLVNACPRSPGYDDEACARKAGLPHQKPACLPAFFFPRTAASAFLSYIEAHAVYRPLVRWSRETADENIRIRLLKSAVGRSPTPTRNPAAALSNVPSLYRLPSQPTQLSPILFTATK